MLPHLLRRRFSTNLAILGLGEGLTRLLTFIAFVHLARVLTPQWFGFVEIALAVLMVAMLIVDLGFPLYGAREVARHPDSVNDLVPRVVSSQLVVAVVTLAVVGSVVLALPLDAKLTSLIIGLGVSLLGVPFLLLWVFQGRKQMAWVAIPQVFRQLIFAGIVLLLIRGPEHLLRLPLAEIAGVAASALMLVIVYRRAGGRLRLSLRIAGQRALFAEVLPIGGGNLMWVLSMYLPIILLATMAEKSVVGRFGAAHRLVMVAHALLAVYVINLYPTMSETARASQAALARLLHRSLSIVTWPVVAGATVATVGAAQPIQIIFGERYAQPDSIAVLAILIWSIPILLWRRHLRCALIALDRQRVDLMCSLGEVLLLVVLLPILTMNMGAAGAAWAMIVSEAAALGWTFLCLRKYVPDLRFVCSLTTFRSGTVLPMGLMEKPVR